jgi:hypothetical protein
MRAPKKTYRRAADWEPLLECYFKNDYVFTNEKKTAQARPTGLACCWMQQICHCPPMKPFPQGSRSKTIQKLWVSQWATAVFPSVTLT